MTGGPAGPMWQSSPVRVRAGRKVGVADLQALFAGGLLGTSAGGHVAVQTSARAVSTRVTVPPDPLEVAAKVDLAPIGAIVVASWLTISAQFLPYPLTEAYEESALRDRGLGLLLLFAAVSWARARTHRRRFAALYGFSAALVLVEFFAGGREPGAVQWNELAVGAVALATTVGGWKTAGRDRPSPSDRAT